MLWGTLCARNEAEVLLVPWGTAQSLATSYCESTVAMMHRQGTEESNMQQNINVIRDELTDADLDNVAGGWWSSIKAYFVTGNEGSNTDPNLAKNSNVYVVRTS